MFATHLVALTMTLAVSTGSLVLAGAGPVIMEIGEAGMRHVVFEFERDGKSPSITVRTEMTGVAGSRLTVRIDGAPVLALDHIFSDAECRFPNGGASMCEIVLGPDHPATEPLVLGFKRGREAHVQIVDAGIMRMDHTISLKGFTRRYGV